MKRHEQLGEARAPDGTVLTLVRHDGDYLIRAGGAELMSTRRHHSEERLAELACASLHQASGARVLIGGLGFGFTLASALRQLPASAVVVVAELLGAVIEWNRTPGYGLGHAALADPRVRLRQEDVAAVLAREPAGFDAIVLDVDNGPDAMTTSGNARLYRPDGIRTTIAALRPGGTLAYWSAADAPKFASALRAAGLTVAVHRVWARGTSGPLHLLFVAQLPDAPEREGRLPACPPRS